MSTHRDTLSPEHLADFDQAMDRAADILARGRDERDQLAATGGPEAVAKAAYVPGGPSETEIAAVYRELQDETRARAGTAA